MKKEDISTGRIIFMLCFTFMVVHIPDLNQSRLERRCLHHNGKKGLIDVVKISCVKNRKIKVFTSIIYLVSAPMHGRATGQTWIVVRVSLAVTTWIMIVSN